VVGLDRHACEGAFAITVWHTKSILTATVTATVEDRLDRRWTLLSLTAARAAADENLPAGRIQPGERSPQSCSLGPPSHGFLDEDGPTGLPRRWIGGLLLELLKSDRAPVACRGEIVYKPMPARHDRGCGGSEPVLAE